MNATSRCWHRAELLKSLRRGAQCLYLLTACHLWQMCLCADYQQNMWCVDVSVYYSPNSFRLVRNLLSFNNLMDGNIITLDRFQRWSVVSGQFVFTPIPCTCKMILKYSYNIYIILYIIYIIKFILTIFPLHAYCPIFNWPLTTDCLFLKMVDSFLDDF